MERRKSQRGWLTARGNRGLFLDCEDVTGEWGAKEAVEDLEVRVEGPLGRVFQHFPNSPGRHREQGTPLRAQEHLRHLAVPLQRQHQVETVRVDEDIVQWWKRVLNGAHLACWIMDNYKTRLR